MEWGNLFGQVKTPKPKLEDCWASLSVDTQRLILAGLAPERDRWQAMDRDAKAELAERGAVARFFYGKGRR